MRQAGSTCIFCTVRSAAPAFASSTPAHALVPPEKRLPTLPVTHTHTHTGATKQQVKDQADRLAAAVAALLGPGASRPFVAATTGGPADGMAADPAGEGTLRVQSLPVGRPASGPGLPQDGFMQFEGLTYGPEEQASFSIQGGAAATSGQVGARSMPGAPVAEPLSVTLAAAGDDPLALHQHAADPARWGWLGGRKGWQAQLQAAGARQLC